MEHYWLLHGTRYFLTTTLYGRSLLSQFYEVGKLQQREMRFIQTHKEPCGTGREICSDSRSALTFGIILPSATLTEWTSEAIRVLQAATKLICENLMEFSVKGGAFFIVKGMVLLKVFLIIKSLEGKSNIPKLIPKFQTIFLKILQ